MPEELERLTQGEDFTVDAEKLVTFLSWGSAVILVLLKGQCRIIVEFFGKQNGKNCSAS